MKKEHIYDFVFAGAGAATLQIVQKLIKSGKFSKASILILEQDSNKKNDRTWCFWEKKEYNNWDEHVENQWDKIYFNSPTFDLKTTIAPFAYKKIRSASYYDQMRKQIQNSPSIEIRYEKVISHLESSNLVEINTDSNNYKSSYFFNSVLNWSKIKGQKKYPVLQQHFVGWFIKTKENSFDSKAATFMDFDIPQNGNTRFMYVLPFTKKKALVEYTLFSKDILEAARYEREIREYLTKKNIRNYEIYDTEKGSIPMSSYPFSKHNSKRILYIGSAGGWTKASTGFTFKFIERKATKLALFLENNTDMRLFDKKNRFWWYDLLFIDVLANYNNKGSVLFTRMFKRNKVNTILRFLDEKTTIKEEIGIILSFPAGMFIKQVLRRLIGSIH